MFSFVLVVVVGPGIVTEYLHYTTVKDVKQIWSIRKIQNSRGTCVWVWSGRAFGPDYEHMCCVYFGALRRPLLTYCAAFVQLSLNAVLFQYIV